MRTALAIATVLGSMAWAHAQLPANSAPAAGACGDCGVVTSIRGVSKEVRPSPTDEGKPSGFVASVPFGGGKPKVGSSMHMGGDAPTVVQTWEVIVRLDDGRFRVVVLDAAPQVRDGDKVRVDNGKLVRRDP